MPRVHTRTKSQRGRTYSCRACGKAIEPGQEFYTWKKRFQGSSYQHVECGYPRPSMLSNRKTAVVEDAIQDAEKEISAWQPSLDNDLEHDGDYSDVSAALESVADSAEEVADEYESSADNMPESLQYGSQAEAMREVAEELRSWADELRSFDPSADLDLPEREDEMSDEEYDAARNDALELWADDVRSQASDAMSDLPEYQG